MGKLATVYQLNHGILNGDKTLYHMLWKTCSSRQQVRLIQIAKDALWRKKQSTHELLRFVQLRGKTEQTERAKVCKSRSLNWREA